MPIVFDLNTMISIAGFLLTLLSLAVVAGKLLQEIKGLSKDVQKVEMKIEQLEKDKDFLQQQLISHEKEIGFWKEVVNEIKDAVKEIRTEFKEFNKDIKHVLERTYNK